MFRLAHVTDPHFRAPRGLPGVTAGELLGKRAVGFLNLRVNRVRKHKMDLLEDMRVDLRAVAPDHLALTGDLSNIAVTSEWRSALAWLDLSGVAPEAISGEDVMASLSAGFARRSAHGLAANFSRTNFAFCA